MCRYNGGYEDLARHWLRHHNPVLGDGEGIVNQYPHTRSNHDDNHDHTEHTETMLFTDLIMDIVIKIILSITVVGEAQV